MGSKARQVGDLLRVSPFSPEFQRADVAAQNPLMWIIEVNGLAVDARWLPRLGSPGRTGALVRAARPG
jgi:hypothetical protein